MYKTACVSLIVGKRLLTDIVEWLSKGRFTRTVGQADCRTSTTITADFFDAVGFVEVGAAIGINVAEVFQRNGDAFLILAFANRQSETASHSTQHLLEAELEGNVFDRVTVIIDVNLVQSVRVHREVIWAAIGVLQRDIVRNQSHVVFTISFITAERVEVRRVDGR